jgi:thiol-disulfide isomerase/thioredoxin
MVDFWASWCSPCKWMDEQTFNRPEVANYLNQKYVSVRVNIDDFDGIQYRSQYNVRYLPTILILDGNGKVIKKYEESMSPSTLLKVLKEEESKRVGSPTKKIKSSTKYTSYPKEKEVKVAPRPRSRYTPSTTGSSKNIANNTRKYNQPKKKATNNNRAIYKASAPRKKANPTTTSNYSPSNNDAISDVGLYRLNVKKAPRNGFSVQVGAYYDYKNVLVEVAKFQKAFAEEVLVHISEFKGSPCYKVMLGHYADYNEASKDKKILKEAGVKDAFVKDLSTL